VRFFHEQSRGDAVLTDRHEAELDEQYRALRARVNASRLYTHEIDEFPYARAAYRALASRLGIVDDHGSLTTPESRNVVRRVRLADGRDAVAKFIPNTREPGEGEVLDAWWRAGLPCAEPLGWGYERIEIDGVPRVTSYLLTAWAGVEPLPDAIDRAEKESRVAELVALVGRFHRADVRVARAHTWRRRLELHQRWTVPLVRAEGLPEPKEWREKLERLSSEGRVVVHGDPAGRNVLVARDGSLVLIDPPGAIVALREADVGRICSQVGGVDDAFDLVDVAARADPSLDPGAVACFAGFDFLTWAGYFLASHPDPDAPVRARDAGDQARKYVELAGALIDRFAGE
jgi:hypothetical protein